MTTPEENGPEGRTEAREAARSKASRMRAAQKKKDRRNGILLKAGIAAGVVGVLVVVTVVLVQAVRPAGPAPQNMAEDGIIIGQDLQVVAVPAATAPAEASAEALVDLASGAPREAENAPATSPGEIAAASATPAPSVPSSEPAATAEPSASAEPAPSSSPAPTASVPATTAPAPAEDVVEIRVYTDYICPDCAVFDETNHDTLERWVSTGAATLQVHPLAMFDNQSVGAKYSTRAANAASCVANFSPGTFFAVNHALFEEQPEQQTAGLDDAALKKLVRGEGAQNLAQIDACIDERTFSGWVAAATKRAMNGPLPGTTVDRVSGTPLVLVNGEPYEGAADDEDEFLAFLTQHAGRTFATATPAPAVSPGAD